MFEVFVVCTAVLIGLVCGWWLRGASPRYVRIHTRSDDAARTREVLERLRELTQNVAADVDKHKALMGRITDELHASEEHEPAAVLSAVGRLIQSNEKMQQQLDSAEQKLENQARLIVNHAVEARTDPLTSLANRRAFDKAMSDAYRSFIEGQSTTTIVMIDVDLFKSLNDNYGHQAGDAVLRGVARVLKENIPDEHLIARYGGEEFAIVFAHSRIEEVEQIAERARQAIGEHACDFEGLALHVTASAGIAQLTPGETLASMIGRADEALYTSKEAGRNCGHIHNGTRIVAVGKSLARSALARIQKSAPAPYEAGISSPEVFSSDVRRRLSEWKGGGAPLCVLFVQIDELDVMRDQCGEENAEAALRAMALSLKAAMREMDHAARFDGETLSLLLPGCTIRGAVAVAERLRGATARCELPKRFNQRHFTISIGVAEAIEDENEDELIERVRSSLSVARMHGQDCTYVHDGLDFHLVGVGSVSVVA